VLSSSLRRAATAWLVALLALVTVVAAHAPVAASGARRAWVPAMRDNVVLLWDEAALQAIRDTRPAPTVTARALAVVHASIYDAWAAYDAKAVGTRLGGTLRRPPAERTPANKRTAISYAAYRALVNLFPARTALFDALMAALGHDPADTSSGTGPAGVGNRAAAAVLAYRAGDAADQAGRSRRYGGIHFEAGDLDGRRLGRRVGANTWSRARAFFDGAASSQER